MWAVPLACLGLQHFSSPAPILIPQHSQTGPVDGGLSARVEFKIHASFSLVANLNKCQLGFASAKVPPRWDCTQEM